VPTPVANTDFSKETENPVTRQITLPLHYQADFLDGADKLTKPTFELDQAVVPFRLNDDWSLITRTKLPAETLLPKNAGGSWADGLSNGYTAFFCRRNTVTASIGGSGRCSTIRQRAQRSARPNGARVRR
jgi:hypothetical protein